LAQVGFQRSDRRGQAPDGGDPVGYVFDAQGTQHVVHSVADNHIYELWWG
jgi:hypothetical protein